MYITNRLSIACFFYSDGVHRYRHLLTHAFPPRRSSDPYIDGSFAPVTSDIAEALCLKAARGALVVHVVEGGPADRAGLKPGEVVTAVNGITVEHPDALGYRLTTAGLGQEAGVKVQSDGTHEVTIALDPAPETPARHERSLEGAHPFAGLLIGNQHGRPAEWERGGH